MTPGRRGLAGSVGPPYVDARSPTPVAAAASPHKSIFEMFRHVPSPAPFGFRPQTTTMLRRGRSAAVLLFANLVVVAYAQTATDDDARSGCNGTVPAPAPQDSQCEPCPYCLHHIDHEASTFSSASRRPRVLLDVVLPLAPSLLALTIARQCGTELRAPSFVVVPSAPQSGVGYDRKGPDVRVRHHPRLLLGALLGPRRSASSDSTRSDSRLSWAARTRS